MTQLEIQVASEKHFSYIDEILRQMAEAAKIRGTGIAKRTPQYIRKKMEEGRAIIALKNQVFVGFCYIETWGHKKFVANSGLIVVSNYRGKGVARKIKTEAFNLSRKKFPEAKIFGLTTGLAVMKINSDLGYQPVTFSELTDDTDFWNGCQSCVNYDILKRTKRRHCLCTGMLFDPQREPKPTKQIKYKHRRNLKNSLKLYGRWMRLKRSILLKQINKNRAND